MLFNGFPWWFILLGCCSKSFVSKHAAHWYSVFFSRHLQVFCCCLFSTGLFIVPAFVFDFEMVRDGASVLMLSVVYCCFAAIPKHLRPCGHYVSWQASKECLRDKPFKPPGLARRPHWFDHRSPKADGKTHRSLLVLRRSGFWGKAVRRQSKHATSWKTLAGASQLQLLAVDEFH